MATDDGGGRASRVRLEALARDRGGRRRPDRGGARRQRLRRAGWPSGCPARPGRGSRSGSITWSSATRPGWPGSSRRWDTSARRSDTPVNAPVFAHPGGIFPRIARSPAVGRRGAGRARGGDQGRLGRGVLPAPRPGPGDRRLSDGPLSDRPGPGRADDAGRGRAPGVSGLRAVPRRAGPRRPDEAARGPRRPGGARPLAGAAATVRRRCRGLRRHRGDARAGRSSWRARPTWRATWSSRPSASTGSRATRAARVQKARQDRLGLGWANHDHHTFRCSRRFFPRLIGMFAPAGLRAAGELPRRRPRRLGRPDRRAPGHGDRDLRRPRPRPRGSHRGLRPPGPARPAPAGHRRPLGRASTASRSSRPACTTSKPSSTSTTCATASRPRPASRP